MSYANDMSLCKLFPPKRRGKYECLWIYCFLQSNQNFHSNQHKFPGLGGVYSNAPLDCAQIWEIFGSSF